MYYPVPIGYLPWMESDFHFHAGTSNGLDLVGRGSTTPIRKSRKKVFSLNDKISYLSSFKVLKQLTRVEEHDYRVRELRDIGSIHSNFTSLSKKQILSEDNIYGRGEEDLSQ